MTQDSFNSESTTSRRWTQPLDRSFIEYLLELEVLKATRYLYYFSLLVVQLDSFKSRGGADPESISQTLGFLLKDEIRGTDLLGKREDNGFFIILYYTDLENAVNVGQRIRERVEHYTFESEPGENRFTVSLGVSCFPTNANDVSGLIKQAEEQLKKAQQKGGNQVCLPA